MRVQPVARGPNTAHVATSAATPEAIWNCRGYSHGEDWARLGNKVRVVHLYIAKVSVSARLG